MYSTFQSIDHVRLLNFKNNFAGAIPSFGLVKVTDVDSDETLQVTQPDTDGEDVYVNGPMEVPQGGNGSCARDWPLYVQYEAGDGTPAHGETWGAGAGSFKLRKNKAGFVIEGGVQAELGVVMARHLDGGGGDGCPWYLSVAAAAIDPVILTEIDLHATDCANVYTLAGDGSTAFTTMRPRDDWLAGPKQPAIWLTNSSTADLILSPGATPTTNGRPFNTPGGFPLHIQGGGGVLLMLSLNPADHTHDVWQVLSDEAGGPSGDQTVAIGFDSDTCAPDCLTQAVVNGRIQSLAAGCGL
jgi:hypothetical protein